MSAMQAVVDNMTQKNYYIIRLFTTNLVQYDRNYTKKD